jgi:hypothetical protein
MEQGRVARWTPSLRETAQSRDDGGEDAKHLVDVVGRLVSPRLRRMVDAATRGERPMASSTGLASGRADGASAAGRHGDAGEVETTRRASPRTRRSER